MSAARRPAPPRSAGPARRRGRLPQPEAGPVPEIRCTPEEVEALRRLAQSSTAGVWRTKRAKIILGTLDGQNAERLMWAVRVPIRSVEAFQRRFAVQRLRAFDQPDRSPTAREAAVERMLAFLGDAPADHVPEWDTLTVRYIGHWYTAREVAELRRRAADGQALNRTDLARALCGIAGLRNERGRPRVQNARDVVVRMEMDNLLNLPPPSPRPPGTRVRAAVAPPCLSGTTLREKVGALRLAQVTSREDSRLWRHLIQSHHYIAEPRLFGAQMRYLVYGRNDATGTEEVVAVLGFAAAVWRVTARDDFIGWNEQQRMRNLKLVINNARFLILPWIRCRNLASRILGAVTRRLPADWEAGYGYRPVLVETFVQLDRFTGASYRAANWKLLGATTGYSVRGTAAREKVPPRAILVYPLCRHFRRTLCGCGDLRSERG